MFSKLWLVVIFLICLIACSKDKQAYDAAPTLEFISVVPSTAVAQQDSIIFKVKYFDGDGDLGENSPNAKNLFLIDSRIQLSEGFRISQLAPSGSAIPIQGTLDVVHNNVILTDSSNQQTATFSIYVVDRAGHRSNTVTSPVVTLNK